jgi:hypothetical protein
MIDWILDMIVLLLYQLDRNPSPVLTILLRRKWLWCRIVPLPPHFLQRPEIWFCNYGLVIAAVDDGDPRLLVAFDETYGSADLWWFHPSEVVQADVDAESFDFDEAALRLRHWHEQEAQQGKRRIENEAENNKPNWVQ